MKTSIQGLLVIAVVGLLAFLAGRRHQPPPGAPAPTKASPARGTPAAPPASAPSMTPGELPAAPVFVEESAPVAEPAAESPATLQLRSAIAELTSDRTNFRERQTALRQWRLSGQLDESIEVLASAVAGGEKTAGEAALLGMAYLQKAGQMTDAADQGILAMSADKAFSVALALDPTNWDARFLKAQAMTYWPAQLNKEAEVIDHFEFLVRQQESRPAEVHFAQTYLSLGDQYAKSGRREEAAATWRRGADLHPDNTALAQRLNPPSGP